MKTKTTALSPQSLVVFHIPSDPRITHPLAAITVAILLPLAGCGVGMTNTSGAVPAGTTITGRVHGGQQPIVGAIVTLYAPGTGGYGTTPTVLTTATAPTDSTGGFTLTRPYPTACPGNSLPTYIVATGGNSGAGDNTSIALAALLPACSSLTANTFVWISEVTTVAAAYALAPFAALSPGTTNIGTSSTNLIGLENALGPATNLADTTTGNARTANAITGLILPTDEIDTLADILAACVNSSPTTRITSSTCTTLFTAATPPGTGSVAPTDTFQAAIDIALNPGNNAAALYALATPSAPFQPTLTAAPSDFAVGIRYNGGPITLGDGIGAIDIDASGNAWVTVYAPLGVGNITEISPAGIFISGSTGYLSADLAFPLGIAIDNNGNAWVTNYVGTTSNLVAVFSPSLGTGALYAPTSLINAGPAGIALDNTATTAWISNFGNGVTGTTVSSVTTAGTTPGADANGSPYVNQFYPYGVAIDSTGNIWVVSNDSSAGGGAGFLTKFTPNGLGAPYIESGPLSTGPGTYPVSVAIDNSNNVWVTELNSIAKFSNTGVLIPPTGTPPPNMTFNGPASVIIDGLGRAWVSNAPTDATGNLLASYPPGSVTAFSPTGTLISTSTTDTTSAGGGLFYGYTAVGTIPQSPTISIKIDPSGNLWISGNSPTAGEFVTELIGIAAPVVTPLSVAVSNNKLGTLP